MNNLKETPVREEARPDSRLGRIYHHIGWKIFSLTGLALCLGILALVLSASAYSKLHPRQIFLSYFQHPLILVLNLLPAVLLIWLFYFVFRRPWAAYLCAAVPVMAIAYVNYFKISLRTDPLLAVDMRLVTEAKGIVGKYSLDFNWLIWLSIGCLVVGLLFAIFCIPKGPKGWKWRTIGSVVCLAVTGISMFSIYLNPKIYNEKTENYEYINRWSDTELFISKGAVYPFLYSFKELMPNPPAGYDKEEAADVLAQYEDADIPEDKKVNIMGIMLEAFSDLSDFPLAAQQEGVQQVYAPWHEFEQQSIHGDLLTNIFAGGTVDSEWAFLTGYTTHDDFRRNTDSYVWYLKNQGYQTVGSHPGFGWFYNRQNVNPYLGFDEYWFTENHYGELVDPNYAIYDSDHILVTELLSQLEDRAKNGPVLSFSVSYQNHGPYADTPIEGHEYLTPAATGMPDVSCNIWNNYLRGISDTIDAMLQLRDGLEASDEPTVLVLFGDHKPWGGNGNSAYTDLGADFDLSTYEGFHSYYSTPYIIWANSAAKEVLGSDFTGEGGTFSPAFLMTRLFDECGYEGPGFMQLSREVRAMTPLVSEHGFFMQDGQIVTALPDSQQEFVNRFLRAQYYREKEITPAAPPVPEE